MGRIREVAKSLYVTTVGLYVSKTSLSGDCNKAVVLVPTFMLIKLRIKMSIYEKFQIIYDQVYHRLKLTSRNTKIYSLNDDLRVILQQKHDIHVVHEDVIPNI